MKEGEHKEQEERFIILFKYFMNRTVLKAISVEMEGMMKEIGNNKEDHRQKISDCIKKRS